MRIVLFTGDHLDFVSELNKDLLNHYSDQIEAIFISRTLASGRKLWKRRWFYLSNFYPFCIRFDDLYRFVRRKRQISNGDLHGSKNTYEYFKKLGYRVEYIDEIRTAKTRSMLEEIKPDVFLFSPFDKIAGPKFLAIPKLGTFNVHLGKIPEYRGGLSSFWVLRFGDNEAGATIHRAIPELDRGEIVQEVRLPVQTNSMHELMLDTVRATSPAIVKALQDIERGEIKPVDIQDRKAGWFVTPTYKDFREFYRRGCRLI